MPMYNLIEYSDNYYRVTTRQRKKLKNAFNNNMYTDIKLSKTQISKIIQSGGFLGSLLSKLASPSVNNNSCGKPSPSNIFKLIH